MRWSPYDDWRLVQYWVRWPRWMRMVSGMVVLGCGVGCFAAALVPGVLVSLIGVLMVAHGAFGEAEQGPPD